MPSIATMIYKLLDVDPTSPIAQETAKGRLRDLDVCGLTCKRCEGTGRFKGSTALDSICFKCKGRGAVGVALTRLTLEQLRVLEDDGTLVKKQRRWVGHDFVRKAHFSLVQFMESTGIATKYGYVRPNAPVGDWDRDLSEMHQRMKEVCQSFAELINADAFDKLTVSEQGALLPSLREAHQAAVKHLRKIAKEFKSYTSWHIKPDYHARCLGMFKRLKENNATTCTCSE